MADYFGLCGLGNVGSGVMRLLEANGPLFRERWGIEPRAKKILVRDPRKPRQVRVPEHLLTTDPRDILDDPEIGVVVELMGGRELAREVVLESLRRGKSVVTANKELLAYHGRELLDAAEEAGVDLLFEASVAGGTPIIRPLKYCLAANRIKALQGILNGTTNYILTRMTREGATYEEALREAQRMGYAEADPTDDVEGHDATRKLVILASLAFGAPFHPDRVSMRGISSLHPLDISFARELGYVIKLLATAREVGDRAELHVWPTLLPFDHPLAKVDGSLNAVLVEGNFVGRVTFIGRGAGGDPTASAVVADLLEALRNRRQGVTSLRCTCHREMEILPPGEIALAHYIRFLAHDRPGVLGKVAQVFGRHQVNLRFIIQRPADGGSAHLVFLTSRAGEEEVEGALRELGQNPELCLLQNHLRAEDDTG